MREIWHNSEFESEQIYLAGDIGGTNTNIALVGVNEENFTIHYQADFSSVDVNDFSEVVEAVLQATKTKLGSRTITASCFSGAGPVQDNDCQLTNVDWNIEGDALAERFQIPTKVINDFIAISYGVPIMDISDPEQITQLSAFKGTNQEKESNVRLVIGAGTGLGVSFISNEGSKFTAFPSEGGHASFAPFDLETVELNDYMNKENGYESEIEQFVCGEGIANIFSFYRDVKKVSLDAELRKIDEAPLSEKAALISKYADCNQVCRDIMRTFVKIYGRVVADFATILLPYGGVYLAGGIVSKNLQYFQENRLFMNYFEKNFRSNIEDLLRTIPVFAIRDYNISLYGAAHCAKINFA